MNHKKHLLQRLLSLMHALRTYSKHALCAKLQQICRHSAMKYALVGAANTLVCWVIMLALMWLGALPEIANIIGYGAGFLHSYMLNKTFTFKSQNSHKRDFTRFSVAMGIAYGVNFLVLVVCYRVLEIDKYLAQIISALCYTSSGYVLARCYVFRAHEPRRHEKEVKNKQESKKVQQEGK